MDKDVGAVILEFGAVGIAMLVVLALVVKVIYPLVKNRTNNGDGRQQFVNKEVERRLDRIESDLGEIRTIFNEMRRTVDVMQAILERVEKNMK